MTAQWQARVAAVLGACTPATHALQALHVDVAVDAALLAQLLEADDKAAKVGCARVVVGDILERVRTARSGGPGAGAGVGAVAEGPRGHQVALAQAALAALLSRPLCADALLAVVSSEGAGTTQVRVALFP